ncbi:4'-phosphopantetheinyl transferase superfamily protein [Streptomyces bambusae]|uniref:4'-phosphopantetheinyl transferase family protein n=1 Tax=Streptomyces bambusae TaxID=1550616 RepID=UPI001CFFE67D|nr:4'-phosphopantetheinyl transferase superfamily protein [Streptomyces bambusae]MCB5170201.1 4'-phosphopantetheinyl transferase superfamily protein [Streptomyces bambusae]
MTGRAALLAEPEPRADALPAQDGLDVWLVRRPHPDRAADLEMDELSEAERKRAATFVRPTDGITYASAHIALRRLLGAYLGMAAADVPFVREPCPGCREPHGRPAVTHPDPPLHFSLAHSHGMAAIAVSKTVVGIDVERLPRDETVEVCTPALHPGERRELEDAGTEERREIFGRVWTRKEAYLKALGTGLSRDPAEDYLGAEAHRRPAGWTLLDIPAGPRHNAAVAVLGDRPGHITVRRLPGEALYAGGTVDLRPQGAADHATDSGA